MNLAPIYEVRRGGTLRLALLVKSGTVTGTEAIRAVGKVIANPRAKPPGDDAADAFIMVSEFAAASGDEPDRWYLTLTDEDSVGLAVGPYAVDARIPMADGSVIQTSHVVVDVQERVTEPA